MTTDLTTRTERARIIGAKIRDARQAAAKSVEECASILGISPDVLESYEMGQVAPSLPEVECLAYTLDVPLESFRGDIAITITGEDADKNKNLKQVIFLRQRIVGALLRQARLEGQLSLEMLAEHTQIDIAKLEAYELGEEPVPLPELEALSGALNRSIREFYDKEGPVGVWATQQRSLREFLMLSPEMQVFVSKPINRPYLDLAKRLSDMSVDKLRAVAEGLLEITY